MITTKPGIMKLLRDLLVDGIRTAPSIALEPTSLAAFVAWSMTLWGRLNLAYTRQQSSNMLSMLQTNMHVGLELSLHINRPPRLTPTSPSHWRQQRC